MNKTLTENKADQKTTTIIQKLYDQDPRRALHWYVWKHTSPEFNINLQEAQENFQNNWSRTPNFVEEEEAGWSLPSLLTKEDEETLWKLILNRKRIQELISTRKTVAANGTDALSNVIYTQAPKEAAIYLKLILSAIKTLKKIPICWKYARTILLYKKNDPQRIQNWRPISISNTDYRIVFSHLG